MIYITNQQICFTVNGIFSSLPFKYGIVAGETILPTLLGHGLHVVLSRQLLFATVYPFRLRSSSFSSSPRLQHIQNLSSDILSSLTPISLSYTSLCYPLHSVSPWCYNLSRGILVCGRMPIQTSAMSPSRTAQPAEQPSCRTFPQRVVVYYCRILPLSYCFSYVHPQCALLFNSACMSPSLCKGLPRYWSVLTCDIWIHCISTLPNGVPFSHIILFVFVLVTLYSIVPTLLRTNK